MLTMCNIRTLFHITVGEKSIAETVAHVKKEKKKKKSEQRFTLARAIQDQFKPT